MCIPSICFNGGDFTNFITFVRSMNFRDKSKGTKVALLHVEDNHLKCMAIDDAFNYIEYFVELYSCEDVIKDYIAVSINDFAALIKCSNCEDRFIIRKQFNQYEFNVIGNGWLPFKNVEIDVSKYSIEGAISDIGTINSIKLRNAITSVLGYTQEYTYARDKYIQFSDTKMCVTSRLSSVITNDTFVNMTLHRDDASMLKSLLKDSFDVNVCKVVSSVEKIMFSGKNFRLTFIATGVEPTEVKYIENITSYVTINSEELIKLVAFSEEYSASKHIVGMSIKNGHLNVNIKNVLAAKHVSTIDSTAIGNVQDTSIDAEVPAHNLLKALKLFQDKHSRNINIYITDELLKSQNSIVLFDDNTQAIINIYNR